MVPLSSGKLFAVSKMNATVDVFVIVCWCFCFVFVFVYFSKFLCSAWNVVGVTTRLACRCAFPVETLSSDWREFMHNGS